MYSGSSTDEASNIAGETFWANYLFQDWWAGKVLLCVPSQDLLDSNFVVSCWESAFSAFWPSSSFSSTQQWPDVGE